MYVHSPFKITAVIHFPVSRFAGQLTIYLKLLDFQFGVHYLKRGGGGGEYRAVAMYGRAPLNPL